MKTNDIEHVLVFEETADHHHKLFHAAKIDDANAWQVLKDSDPAGERQVFAVDKKGRFLVWNHDGWELVSEIVYEAECKSCGDKITKKNKAKEQPHVCKVCEAAP